MKGITTNEELNKVYEELARESTPEAIKKAKSKRVGKTISNVIFVLILVLVFFSLIFIQSIKEKNQTPAIFGYSIYYIETGSMQPTLPVGTLILSKNVTSEEAANLEVGDVVTFYWDTSKTTIVTHRIVSIATDKNGNTVYHTKGDNPSNSIDGGSLTQDRIIAKMIRKLK